MWFFSKHKLTFVVEYKFDLFLDGLSWNNYYSVATLSIMVFGWDWGHFLKSTVCEYSSCVSKLKLSFFPMKHCWFLSSMEHCSKIFILLPKESNEYFLLIDGPCIRVSIARKTKKMTIETKNLENQKHTCTQQRFQFLPWSFKLKTSQFRNRIWKKFFRFELCIKLLIVQWIRNLSIPPMLVHLHVQPHVLPTLSIWQLSRWS